ncbi:MAG: hypothetical protein J7598_05360 [Mitsuaria chitosanitabida]|uniref:hypothetical protein n=1 Tax=Roseateles chitosanitabidus TaxID=65048 RepID=UPI001B04DD63|nr:hypothetical protein [Roseateles chitosanitabidus]MBO9686021.1 hypothetical protein [Roseateles chitosanitabidus]
MSKHARLDTEQILEALKQFEDNMGRALQRLDARIDDLAWKTDRHQKRLESIEDHPPYPLEQPGRHYATESQSVSMARRKRLGHLG